MFNKKPNPKNAAAKESPFITKEEQHQLMQSITDQLGPLNLLVVDEDDQILKALLEDQRQVLTQLETALKLIMKTSPDVKESPNGQLTDDIKKQAESHFGVAFKASEDAKRQMKKLMTYYQKNPEKSERRKIKMKILEVMLDYPQLTLRQVLFLVHHELKKDLQDIKMIAKEGRNSSMGKLLDLLEPGWVDMKPYSEPLPVEKERKNPFLPG